MRNWKTAMVFVLGLSALSEPNAAEKETAATSGIDTALRPLASHGVARHGAVHGGIATTGANFRNGNFPIPHALTRRTKSAPHGLTRTFIEYSNSSRVADMIVAHDFVPYLD